MNLIASRVLTMLLLVLAVVACSRSVALRPPARSPHDPAAPAALHGVAALPAPPTPQPTAAPPTPQPTAALPTAELAAEHNKRPPPDRLIIGSIALDRPLVAVGLDDRNDPVVPDHDVAWYSYSASPGDGENVVVWGHALRFRAAPDLPAPLERVRDAQVGDSVTLVTADGAAHQYVIAEQVWATPDQVSWILPTGDERLTIVNCIGDEVFDATGAVVSMTHRLITIARPVAE